MIGKKLGDYEILDLLGRGGMGEVYRARDPKLDRDVAVKVITEHRLESAEARSRFEREAKAVAALSHPNILAIHDFGEQDGTVYAVTELLEGETLLEQMERGAIPVRQALELAGQAAEGLAAAHEKGIIHRDIKPGNLFVTPDGRVKILDFGLAKTGPMADAETVAGDAPDSTAPGTVLGTVRYMSPEQVRAETADARSDIFSLGTVLWEMLSGEIAFTRDSAVETMNAILHEEPRDISSVNDSVPASVDRIIHRCLAKRPEQRFQSARDLSFALRNSSDSSARTSGLVAAAPAAKSRPVVPLLLAAVALLAVGFFVGTFLAPGSSTTTLREPVKVYPFTHSGRDSGPSVSPDGKMIAFRSERDGQHRIWLRQMQGGVEAPLTEGPDAKASFSPDGSSILFIRNEGISFSAYRVPVLGGTPRKLIHDVGEACWSPDGRQVAFSRGVGDAANPEVIIGVVDTQGGAERVLIRIPNRYLYGLDWSPDGRWISMASTSSVQNATRNFILLIDATTGEMHEAVERNKRFAAPSWTPGGERLILAESTSQLGDMSSSLGRVLLIDPFSQEERSLFWVQSVWAGSSDYVSFDFLSDDTVIFDEILWRGSLTRYALTDGGLSSDYSRLTHGISRDRQPAYSPDGKLVAFSSNRSGNLDIWILELGTGATWQLTDDDADDWDPGFTADGKSILWSSNRSGNLEIWMAASDGSGARKISNDGEDAENPSQTPDGDWVIYMSGNLAHPGLWKIRSDGSDAVHLAEGAYLLPETSPDGRHVLFVANDAITSTVRIYVCEMESGEIVFETSAHSRGFQLQIQPGRARWMPDGNSFLFVGMDADTNTNLYKQEFRPGEDTRATRRPLLQLPEGEDLESFGIAPDGKTVTVSLIDHFRSLKMAEGLRLNR